MTPHFIPASVTAFEDGDSNENPRVTGKPAPEQIEVCVHDPHWPQNYAADSPNIKQAFELAQPLPQSRTVWEASCYTAKGSEQEAIVKECAFRINRFT